MYAKRYVIELLSAIALYAVLLIGSVYALNQGMVASGWHIPVALIPMLATPAIVWAVLRQLKRMDEYQRKLQFESLCLAFLGTALITFSYGFLEGVGFPKLSMFAVWPIMATLWAIGSVTSAWRNRA